MVTLWMIGWFIGLGVLATEGVNTPSFAEHRFSRMRSKGSRFTLGVWGLRVCSLDVAFVVATDRNRSQPFATVRNRPQPSATVRTNSLWEVLQRWSFFGGFQCVVVSFRVAGVALRDIQTCSAT